MQREKINVVLHTFIHNCKRAIAMKTISSILSWSQHSMEKYKMLNNKKWLSSFTHNEFRVYLFKATNFRVCKKWQFSTLVGKK